MFETVVNKYLSPKQQDLVERASRVTFEVVNHYLRYQVSGMAAKNKRLAKDLNNSVTRTPVKPSAKGESK